MGSGEGLPEAAAGGPPACTSIRIPPSGHGLISASGIYQEMEKNSYSSRLRVWSVLGTGCWRARGLIYWCTTWTLVGISEW